MKKDPDMQYRLLDSGNLLKLEQAGPWRLIRPALNAFWRPSLPQTEWDMADAVFQRNSTGGGKWTYRRKLPESWWVEWGGFKLLAKPTGFGHLGFFCEQFRNWAFFEKWLSAQPGEVNALNLFAYSGVGSMAMARGGAGVCHLDASKGMAEWGRLNQEQNKDVPDSIRWIVDDVMKFCRREIRRGSKYQLIALDPPSFGRGSSGQVWKIEEDLPVLLGLCRELVDVSRPYCVELSSHSPGFTAMVMERLLRQAFGSRGQVTFCEMSIPESTGKELPAGISVRFLAD